MPGSRFTKEEVLAYHAEEPRGKVSVLPTKPTSTQRDLSIAYSPGVAIPCLEIQRDKDLAYRYTAKGNLVAVVSNGTAVLGLGNIGPVAGKPVMEGKAVLFKKFADIDVFDLEVDATEVDAFCKVVKALEPTFGGVNLEDIKAPECFAIEERLRGEMQIPVFHDDQHGTAIISGAALLNALEIQGKRIEDIRIVVSGAGAAAIASASFYLELGARKENITLVDSRGVVASSRMDLNPYKARFARETTLRTLAEALQGTDVFVGVSAAGIVTPDMVRSMAPRPIVFALANPDPEIPYDQAKAARADAIVATGRSDFPNQVNNVLGYPYIFRGALDVRARAINEAMKVAAARALALLAKEDVPDEVRRAYSGERIEFGPDYIIPKPFDARVLLWVAPAVARAAMESGVARKIVDLEKYTDELDARLGKSREMMRIVVNKAKRDPRRIVFPEGEDEIILRACQILFDEGIAKPILLGNAARIQEKCTELRLDFPISAIEPRSDPRVERYAAALFDLRGRRGVTQTEAVALVRGNPFFFASLMVHTGDADGLVGGHTVHYPEALRPALQVVGLADGVRRAVGMYMMTIRRKVFFFADATVNIEPSAEDLAEIASLTAKVARQFDIEPRVAMLSFSNFGSARHPLAEKVAAAVRMLHEREPGLVVDGEMQADTAVVEDLLQTYPFSRLKEPANVLIFPDLQSANIAYKLMQRLSDAEATGPMLQGMAKPVHILQRGDDVHDVVNMAAVAVLDAQTAMKSR
jgi:malate dehydrogenase (oxaloacetate-decarboxylating)(NADP+)